nr:MICOS complex subunit MIC60 [Tanacetum cinerariifolium]
MGSIKDGWNECSDTFPEKPIFAVMYLVFWAKLFTVVHPIRYYGDAVMKVDEAQRFKEIVEDTFVLMETINVSDYLSRLSKARVADRIMERFHLFPIVHPEVCLSTLTSLIANLKLNQHGMEILHRNWIITPFWKELDNQNDDKEPNPLLDAYLKRDEAEQNATPSTYVDKKVTEVVKGAHDVKGTDDVDMSNDGKLVLDFLQANTAEKRQVDLDAHIYSKEKRMMKDIIYSYEEIITQIAVLAQLVERMAFNHVVVGSSPTDGAIVIRIIDWVAATAFGFLFFVLT